MSTDGRTSIYFVEQRELRRKIASLEKAIDRNEDRITKLRKLHQEQIQTLGKKIRHILLVMPPPSKVPSLDSLPYGDQEEQDS